MKLLAVTGDAFGRIDAGGGSARVELDLVGSGAQCISVAPRSPDLVYVGTRGNGVRRSKDGGNTWEDAGLPQPDVFSVAVSPADGAVYAGCEPSALWVSRDHGRTWSELESLRAIPSAPTWSFPPRPWTSHVRWIAPSPHDADVLLVGIELGGMMRTEDRGRTWLDHRPGAQPDVHSVIWHPIAEERAYEAGGGGAAWSSDGGLSWRPADEGRDRHYTWAVAVDPTDPNRWYVSASTGPFAAHGRRSAEARLYRWAGTGPWEALDGGLGAELDSMPYALLALDGRLVAGFRNGELWASRDRGDTWKRTEPEGEPLPSIVALSPLP
jgi:photosystem II stability/assembly factor-like uncharacterized protein